MRTHIPARALNFAAIALSAVVLGGCGGSAPQAAAPVSDQVVFTSAADCTETGKIKPELCSQAIANALEVHLAKSPVYRSLSLCEAAEGIDKCERMDAKAYRPRLSAMLVSLSAVANSEATGAALPAIPLYPTIAGEQGFRQLDKSILLIDGEHLVFSPQAVAAAELGAVVATP